MHQVLDHVLGMQQGTKHNNPGLMQFIRSGRQDSQQDNYVKYRVPSVTPVMEEKKENPGRIIKGQDYWGDGWASVFSPCWACVF